MRTREPTGDPPAEGLPAGDPGTGGEPVPALFADTLRQAISDSGLTLDRLRHHLRQRGVSVSVAALSYWQRGRSRPERTGSLAAVRALEEILELSPGSLAGLLAVRQPPGRTRRSGASLRSRLQEPPVPGTAAAVFTQVDRSCDHRLARLSLHDVYQVGSARRPERLRVRQVLRALDDGVDRTTAGYRTDSAEEAPPVLTGLRYCRPGRVRAAGDHIAFELFFDRVLIRGDTTVVEYELEFPGERPVSLFYDRWFRYPVADYLAVVEFHPDAIPVRCHQYERETAEAPRQRLGELWIGTSYSAHVTGHGITSGIIGIDWEWG